MVEIKDTNKQKRREKAENPEGNLP